MCVSVCVCVCLSFCLSVSVCVRAWVLLYRGDRPMVAKTFPSDAERWWAKPRCALRARHSPCQSCIISYQFVAKKTRQNATIRMLRFSTTFVNRKKYFKKVPNFLLPLSPLEHDFYKTLDCNIFSQAIIAILSVTTQVLMIRSWYIRLIDTIMYNVHGIVASSPSRFTAFLIVSVVLDTNRTRLAFRVKSDNQPQLKST